jgi:hypothetical protein
VANQAGLGRVRGGRPGAEHPRILCTPEAFSGGVAVHLHLKARA